MSATATAPDHPAAPTGTAVASVELARYTLTAGERVLLGQRVDGVARIIDRPATGPGRAFLVERHVEEDGNQALQALLADYITQAEHHDQVPMLICPLNRQPERVA